MKKVLLILSALFLFLVPMSQSKASAASAGDSLISYIENPYTYNAELARISAHVSLNAYSTSLSSKNTLGSFGFTDVKLYKSGDMQALVGVKKINSYQSIIAISFRGSDNASNWLTKNANTTQEKVPYGSCTGCKVGEGFLNYAMNFIDLENSIKFSSLNNKNLRQIISQNLQQSGTTNSRRDIFWITGHSLGGATAGIYSSYLSSQGSGLSQTKFRSLTRNQIVSYTFGAPEFANSSFLNYYKNSFYSYRVHNQYDPVANLNFSYWEHFGSGKVLTDVKQDNTGIGNHSIHRYIKLLGN